MIIPRLLRRARLENRELDHDPNITMLHMIGLEKFETIEQCTVRNMEMIARFRHLSNDLSGVHDKFAASAFDRHMSGWDGDWLASRGHRSRIIPQAYRILDLNPGPLFFVTIVHPKWEIAEGCLRSSNIHAAKQWLRRRLQQMKRRIVAIGGFECSLRIDQPKIAWAGHFHFVVAGAPYDELREALTIEAHYLTTRYSKPVVIQPIGDLASRIGYSTKRVVNQNVAYRGRNGRQQRRQLPLALKHQIESDLWLLSLRAGDRTFLYGCRHHHGTLVETTRRMTSPT